MNRNEFPERSHPAKAERSTLPSTKAQVRGLRAVVESSTGLAVVTGFQVLKGELEAAIAAFINRSHSHRYHESLGNLTPAGVFCGRGQTVLTERRRIKQQTIQNRRLNHQRQAA